MITASRKRIIMGMAALLILLAAGLAVRKLYFSKPKTTFITADVARTDLEESVLASGTLKAFKTVAVGAQVTGQLKTLHVALGDKVKKGQLLAEIDPVLPQNTLKDAEAQVENLRAQKRSKQALLKQYDLAFQRQSQMSARDAASKADLESAQAQLESTRHDIAALEAQIKKAVIAVDTAKANVGYTRIHAPTDGTVISIDTEEGQTVVSTQTATTILTLATLDTMTVKAKISEADVTRVKPGLPTYFTLLGGMIGIVLSYGVGKVFSLFVSSFAMKFSVLSIVSAFLCSTLIGVIFGFLPARNAARLDPIEALARE